MHVLIPPTAKSLALMVVLLLGLPALSRAQALPPCSSLPTPQIQGIRVKRDSEMSVMYPEELDSTKSSVTLQRTDRHGILGQKSTDFQVSL